MAKEKMFKRNHQKVDFNPTKIENAIGRALKATRWTELREEKAKQLSDKVVKKIEENYFKRGITPHIEHIQNLVEYQLMTEEDTRETAKAYILYRESRTEARRTSGFKISEEFKNSVKVGMSYFPSPYEYIIYLRTYARWKEEENRREIWPETVDRFMLFMKETLQQKLDENEYQEIYLAILKMEVMPSMRLLQFAGEAVRRNNITAYNCCYIAPRCNKDVADLMYILMCGTGVSFSVESHVISAFPKIMPQTEIIEDCVQFQVPDDREGWCDALQIGLDYWFSGKDVKFDYSLVRPQGEKLQISGGTASGPAPLKQLLDFCRAKILSKQGSRLNSLDWHDILCMCGDIVVCGGVRRSAMLSLSDLEDNAIRDCKHDGIWNNPETKQRGMANNSASYKKNPSDEELLTEWNHLIKFNSGERGIFNRYHIKKNLPKRRADFIMSLPNGEEELNDMGCNPCGEIFLRNRQFCNLSSVICRSEDNLDSLMRKQRISAILGTFQACLTNFKYVSEDFKIKCQQEALLGCSLSGQMDCVAVRDGRILEKLRLKAVQINEEYAKRFGINPSTAVTCVKPEGTLSQMTDCSSGIHPCWDNFFIRRVRMSTNDPLARLLKDEGVPCNPEVGTRWDNCTVTVFDFPKKAKQGAVLRQNLSSFDMLEHWKVVKINYTEHNPSVTINIRKNEWIETLQWIKKNWSIVGGIAFLPYNDSIYQLAPYETITEQKYMELKKEKPKVDFSRLILFEDEDGTNRKAVPSCEGDKCIL